jgi:hypothetical protein
MKNIVTLLIVTNFLLMGFGNAQPICRTAEVASSEVTPNISNNSKAVWDVLFTYKLPDQSAPMGCFYWEGKFYVAGWYAQAPGNEMGKIWRYTFNGTTLEPDGFVVVSGLVGIYSFHGFTTDGTYIYGVNSNSRFYKIDPETWTIVEEVLISMPYLSGIAYDKSTGGFWLCNYSGDMTRHVNSEGQFTQNLFTYDADLVGLAYDDITEGGPYLLSSNGTNSSSNKATIGRWNIATEIFEGDIYNLAEMPGGVQEENIIGGIETFMMDEKLYLLGINQRTETIFALKLFNEEIEKPAPVSYLTATQDENGEFSASISWTNPTLTHTGNPLTELTAIKIFLNDIPDPLSVVLNPGIGDEMAFAFTQPSAGIYKFCVIAENSAGESEEECVTVTFEVDVNEMEFVEFNIYPNPVKDRLTIVRNVARDRTWGEIYNTTGAKVMSFEMNEPETEINVSALSSGIYFIRLMDGNNKVTRRFVKE